MGDGRQETRDGRQEAGDGGWETGDESRETGDGRWEMGDERRETGDGSPPSLPENLALLIQRVNMLRTLIDNQK